MLFRLLLMILPLIVEASELPNLNYPNAKPGKLKYQVYNKLDLHTKSGYVSHYGKTWSQKFTFDAELKDHKSKLKDFFIKAFNINKNDFNKKFATFQKNEGRYYLKINSYARSYDYVLMLENSYPNVIHLPTEQPYKMEKKHFDIPQNILIPDVEGFAIRRANYVNYNEVTWYYKHNGNTKHIHKGRHWKIDFAKTLKDSNSYRYILAHDYKTKIKSLGAVILEDKDESFIFKFNNTYGKFNSYENTFSLEIVEEEVFVQSLILTPDAIKTELDKSGKITLEGIFFDFDKATLKPQSHKAILPAVTLLQRYNDLELSVHGYTDSKGDDGYNLNLSHNRAKAVMEAIIAEGIKSSRLSYKGHGEDDPVANNETEEGRAQNRRVELHKERGGNKSSIITIDFIKPIKDSIVTAKRSYKDQQLTTYYSKPYSKTKETKTFKGDLEVLSYDIIKNGKRDKEFSRKAIIKNYANILELYNAKILGLYGDNLSFEIPDRGDGKKIYGKIEAYEGSYNIRFLIQE